MNKSILKSFCYFVMVSHKNFITFNCNYVYFEILTIILIFEYIKPFIVVLKIHLLIFKLFVIFISPIFYFVWQIYETDNLLVFTTLLCNTPIYQSHCYHCFKIKIYHKMLQKQFVKSIDIECLRSSLFFFWHKHCHKSQSEVHDNQHDTQS